MSNRSYEIKFDVNISKFKKKFYFFSKIYKDFFYIFFRRFRCSFPCCWLFMYSFPCCSFPCCWLFMCSCYSLWSQLFWGWSGSSSTINYSVSRNFSISYSSSLSFASALFIIVSSSELWFIPPYCRIAKLSDLRLLKTIVELLSSNFWLLTSSYLTFDCWEALI